jgi:ubiquinone biosynthesis monooxygenase Coq7
MNPRAYSFIDSMMISIDNGIRTVFGQAPVTERPNPADSCEDSELGELDRRLSGRLMRVNHAGEVAAQALYEGQALTAHLPDVRDKMERAALEENDHLNWCAQRIEELGQHTSLLNPVWYTGSLAIGALAGLAGDKWSLGFVAETEHQVVRHLEDHLQRMPSQDFKSRAILEQMKEDEGRHATTALEAGGAQLPQPVRQLMTLTSRFMTRTAFWI